MLTLLSDCHFWTIRDEVRVKSNDFGVFRYVRQRDAQTQDLATLAKRDYTERRNGIAVLKNSRKSAGRLKDNIKKLEELLKTNKVVYSQWKDTNQVFLLFANGIITHICIDIYTGDILRMVFEKYLVGKLAAETITDAFFTRTHIVLAYNTNQLTIVYLQKPNTRPQGLEKITNMEPKIFHVIIPGTTERKIARHLTVNSSFDLFVVWTKSSQNEVYPWRPTIRDQDRANIHVFKLKGMQLESISYCWSENDPLSVDFLRSSESQLLTLEQKISRKGEISAELCSFEIGSGKMQRTALTSIPMGTQLCCFAFSPDQEKLFLASIDRNICLHDLVLQTTKFAAQIEIVPTQCSWHCDSAMIVTANERSQFQCFDLALNPIASQLQSEDVTPLNLLDLSHYFSTQSTTLLNITFNPKPDLTNFSHNYAQTDCFLLLLYEHGPIGCLRLFSGAGMRGDIHNSGLTADVLVDKYLALNQLEKAVNMLVALNWETYGAMCLITLHKIANYVFFRCESKRKKIELMAKALKTFTDALSEETKDEFSDQIFDLKRRFFFYLLRKNLYVEAFEIAQDIEDYDLFMDLFNITKIQENSIEFSKAAFSQAAAILHVDDHSNANLSLICDYRTESDVCSQSSDTETQQVLQNILKNYVPPLPSFKSKVFNAEMIKINIPKPELKITEPRLTQNKVYANPQKLRISNNVIATTTTSTENTNGTTTINIQENKTTITTASNLISKTANGTSNGHATILTTRTYDVTDDAKVQAEAKPLLTTNSVTKSLPRLPPNISLATNLATSIATQSLQPPTPLHHAKPAVITEFHAPLLASQRYPIPHLSTYSPKFFQHPLVSGNIPPTSNVIAHEDYQKRLLQKKPTASILSNGSNAHNGHTTGPNNSNMLGVSTNGNDKSVISNGKPITGEKNKVKFSDTIQVAVVPEIPRKEKSSGLKRNGYVRPVPRNITNPRKELADSLPLCHPHDDYLKDFNPLPTAPRATPRQIKEEKLTRPPASTAPPAIKVVHFGVV